MSPVLRCTPGLLLIAVFAPDHHDVVVVVVGGGGGVVVVVMLNTYSVSELMNYVFFNVNVTAHHHTHHSDNFSDRSQA